MLKSKASSSIPKIGRSVGNKLIATIEVRESDANSIDERNPTLFDAQRVRPQIGTMGLGAIRSQYHGASVDLRHQQFHDVSDFIFFVCS
jgi:hypothetical protein